MKMKITNKRAKTRNNLVSVGYADLSTLFSGAGVDPLAYNCGIYGWNYDLFHVYFPTDKTEKEYKDINIITGYRNYPNTAVKLPYSFYREYEKKAVELANRPLDFSTTENCRESLNKRKQAHQELLYSFCRAALEYLKENN